MYRKQSWKIIWKILSTILSKTIWIAAEAIMKKARKVSPSKVRYDQTHPLICFRTTIEEKERIEAMAETTGKTISEIVKELLLNGCIDYENAINTALDVGKMKGKLVWGIKIPCNKCGKDDDIFLIPNDCWHKLIIKLFKSYRFGHTACYEKEKLSQ